MRGRNDRAVITAAVHGTGRLCRTEWLPVAAVDKEWAVTVRASVASLGARSSHQEGQIMAQRKSSKAVEARARARELAAESMEREKRMLGAAETYLVAAAEVAEVADWEAAQIEKVREQAAMKRTKAEQGSREAVAALLAEGISKRDAAARLGVPVREVGRLAATDEAAESANGADDYGDAASSDEDGPGSEERRSVGVDPEQ